MSYSTLNGGSEQLLGLTGFPTKSQLGHFKKIIIYKYYVTSYYVIEISSYSTHSRSQLTLSRRVTH